MLFNRLASTAGPDENRYLIIDAVEDDYEVAIAAKPLQSMLLLDVVLYIPKLEKSFYLSVLRLRCLRIWSR